MKRERLIEFFVVMVFLVLVFIMILIGIGLSEIENGDTGKAINTHTEKTVVKDSYNVYNYNYEYNFRPIYYHLKNYEKKDENLNKDYYSYGKHDKDYLFGTYANTFKVYVKNRKEGKYYTVKFYFEDKWGDEEIVEIRKYIFSEEEELFYFRDISKGEGEYYSWKYRVYTG